MIYAIPLPGLDNELIENTLAPRSLKEMVNQPFPYILGLLRSLILSLYSRSGEQFFFELRISQPEIALHSNKDFSGFIPIKFRYREKQTKIAGDIRYTNRAQ